jgi:hypothetical protein
MPQRSPQPAMSPARAYGQEQRLICCGVLKLSTMQPGSLQPDCTVCPVASWVASDLHTPGLTILEIRGPSRRTLGDQRLSR